MLNEDQLIENYNVENLNRITRSIENFVNEVYDRIPFDLGFCDHEADLEEISNYDTEKYSLAFLSRGDHLIFIENSWHINGLTSR